MELERREGRGGVTERLASRRAYAGLIDGTGELRGCTSGVEGTGRIVPCPTASTSRRFDGGGSECRECTLGLGVSELKNILSRG